MSRAPHGARGLKSDGGDIWKQVYRSRPARGAWIEIQITGLTSPISGVAPRTGRVD